MPDRKPNFRKGVPACFAPPITTDNLATYKALAATAPAPIADGMRELIEMVETFQQTPASSRRSQSVPLNAVKDGQQITSAPCTPLEDVEVERIWDLVPWDHELDAMGRLFEELDNNSQRPLRDAAFHLLWYGRELVRDREPMTNDTL